VSISNNGAGNFPPLRDAAGRGGRGAPAAAERRVGERGGGAARGAGRGAAARRDGRGGRGAAVRAAGRGRGGGRRARAGVPGARRGQSLVVAPFDSSSGIIIDSASPLDV
jgi:hypothetical protein